MKIQIKEKDARELDCLAVWYCDLQYLLYYKNPIFYTAGIYGWKADFYNVGRLYISTGYAPVWKPVNYELCKKYDRKAEKILHWRRNRKRETKMRKLDELLQAFISEAD